MQDLLAVEVRKEADGGITLHQEKYIFKVLERFEPPRIAKVNRGSTPYSDQFDSLIKAAMPDPFTPGKCEYPHLVCPFQERCGSVMYLANSSRPDIAYPVNQLCRAMTRPTPELMEEFNWLLNYLDRTRSFGLTYHPGDYPLCGQTDASFETHFSVSGWVILWQRAAIAWGSKKQKSSAQSSCESEIMALSEGAKDMVYFRKLVGGIVPETVKFPTNLATDNLGARDLSYNPEHHDRSKHIERRHFYVRDMVEKLELSVPYVPTEDNIADIFTKTLKPTRFVLLRSALMGQPRPSPIAPPGPSTGAAARE